ncbi:MAG: polysaccharide biosynthesis tyrosine autokinase [Nocardiaceae bacterium]|nr:polysaccharide biosynthesis tyrosine autokinase [Nocardiaceae bacterium]
MDVVNYLRRIIAQWRLIVIVTVLTAIGVGGLTLMMTPQYSTTSTFFISSKTSDLDVSAAMASSMYTQSKVLSYTAVAASDAMADAVIQDLKLDMSPTELQSEVKPTNVFGTVLIDITVTDPSPDRALAISQSIARNYNPVLSKIDATNSDRMAVVASLLTPAALPTAPSSPRLMLNLIVAILSGAILGVAIAALRDVLDNRITTEDDLRAVTKSPIMGSIAFDRDADAQPISIRSQHNVRGENFRHLRANLRFLNTDSDCRVIAVTSSAAGEGKTSVASNLAVALAESDFSVCLVDADLRRPQVSRVFGIVGGAGLTSVLIRQLDLDVALQDVGRGLRILSSGPIPPNPSEILASHHFSEVVATLRERFDFVVIDTAPLVAVSDGAEVARIADGTLLVVKHKYTTDSHLQKSVRALQSVDARLVGAVFNCVPLQRLDYEYYDIKAYTRGPAKRTGHRRAGTQEAEPFEMVNHNAAHFDEPAQPALSGKSGDSNRRS